ncbi:SWR1-complex protein 5 [Pyrenochaeta sp. MPI-SDFR-AT-0127]|nr:SWR1-complex protein 5 [Pyrenochaeta sp. MPI-SDFR-AT-0127]
MAPIDYDEDADTPNEKYHESSDDDFNPDTAPAGEASSSEDEEDAISIPAQRKGKRKAPSDEELDSGDEVTIQSARRKRSKKKKKGSKDDNEDLIASDDDGEGGLIKTRAQRRVEQKERRPLARTEGATVDVDALWAQMSAAPLRPLQPFISEAPDTTKDQAAPSTAQVPTTIEEEELVTVKKVYTFAGQDTTEEKQIPRSHLEKYFKDGWKSIDAPDKPVEADAKPTDPDVPAQPKVRRPLRRPSRFDPNPTGFVRALAPEHQLSWPRKGVAALQRGQENMPAPEAPKQKVEKAQKLNVVDKSRMDWTGFVDKEGIAEELDTHGKTKEAYLGRMEFLAGVEARREDERLKMKTAAAAATMS